MEINKLTEFMAGMFHGRSSQLQGTVGLTPALIVIIENFDKIYQIPILDPQIDKINDIAYATGLEIPDKPLIAMLAMELTKKESEIPDLDASECAIISGQSSNGDTISFVSAITRDDKSIITLGPSKIVYSTHSIVKSFWDGYYTKLKMPAVKVPGNYVN